MDSDTENYGATPAMGKKSAKGALTETASPNLLTKRLGKSVEQIYQKKTQLEHILLRPDTYVGSVEPITTNMWVYDKNLKRIVNRSITFTPGLYKIFDEILVNAADNKQRDSKMNAIKVDINSETNTISVYNNGQGVPIVVHKEHGVYVPELIFGHLLTSSNYDDSQKKVTGGRNGYGAKLANIFSTEFTVETSDSALGQKYKQVFRNNMGEIGKPSITKGSKKAGSDFTRISFKPDLGRFKMTHLDEDTISLLVKRVYDVAGVTDKSVSVWLNGEKMPIKSFKDYVQLYRPDEEAETPLIHSVVNPRWEVCFSVSDGQFQQVSFVNSICTIKGGQHVNYITDQLVDAILKVVKKKNKGVNVRPHHVKNHLSVYVNCLIENPAFDSQTKETLTTRAKNFGSACVLEDKFLRQVSKSGVVDAVLSWAKFRQANELKKTGGTKKKQLTGIPKLDDANNAGGAKGHQCTLILTEGDSAKALAISGLSVVGRDNYGVFPLKGKLLNVREATHKQIMNNAEIQNIVKILGLKYGQTYTSTKGLRYGHLMIMADQDHDGSHIKGLVINFLHHFWPSLLKLPGFLKEFITPIVKCTKGARTVSFFTMPEYQHWLELNNGGRGWRIKYYKGLGTSTSAEAKDYFSKLETHMIDFVYNDNDDDQLIDLAFSKKRADDRKRWLQAYRPGTHIDYSIEKMYYSEFVNKELILFSMADNLRSIPSAVDGLKPSQRKVLYSCFKRNLKHEIKVAQLAGYVSEHSAYHHGEQSLAATIIGMAQTFVGSNNINLLYPAGQFGTRLMGGKDAASPRYIFTKLNKITRYLYREEDDPILEYQEEDGQKIEPVWYMPIIPMVLVNGSEGIGTGWSSSIPPYDPRKIIGVLRDRIAGRESEPLTPWFRGFNGEILDKGNSTSFLVRGVGEFESEDTFFISELPIRKWTQDYKQWLEELVAGVDSKAKGGKAKGGKKKAASQDDNGEEKEEEVKGTKVLVGGVKSFKENHTDTTVRFSIKLTPDAANRISPGPDAMKKFKLETSMSTTNMHLFDRNGQISKYENPERIIDAFFDLRLDHYSLRKSHLLQRLGEEFERLDNKARFIVMVVDGKLTVAKRKKSELVKELVSLGFKGFKGSKATTGAPSDASSDTDDSTSPTMDSDLEKSYNYLLSMPLWSLTKEKVEELLKQKNDKAEEIAVLEKMTPSDLWLKDLDDLEMALDEFETEYNEIMEEDAARAKAFKRTGVKGKAIGAKKPRTKKAGPKKPSAAGGGGGGGGGNVLPELMDTPMDGLDVAPSKGPRKLGARSISLLDDPMTGNVNDAKPARAAPKKATTKAGAAKKKPERKIEDFTFSDSDESDNEELEMSRLVSDDENEVVDLNEDDDFVVSEDEEVEAKPAKSRKRVHPGKRQVRAATQPSEDTPSADASNTSPFKPSPRRKRVRVAPEKLEEKAAEFDFTLSDDEEAPAATKGRKRAPRKPAARKPAAAAKSKKAPAKGKKAAGGTLAVDLTASAGTARPRRRAAAAKAISYAESDSEGEEEGDASEVEDVPVKRGGRNKAAKSLDDSAFAPESEEEEDAEWGDSDDGSLWGN